MTMSIFDRIYYWNLRRQKKRDDDYSRYVTAYGDGEKNGFEKGSEIGFKKGSEIGFEKGSEIGFEKGTTANKLETARRMKGKSYSLAEICELTGLDKETVEGL